MLIDTHAHLYWDSFKEDLDEVIQRALDSGVTTIINVGVDVEKSKEALRQTQEKLDSIPGLNTYSTIGIHPHEALNYAQPGQMSSGRGTNVHEDIAELERIYNSDPEKIVAVGECGLDFSSTSEEPELTSEVFIQKKLFQAQIDLAKKLNLPLIVHCRDDRSKDPQNSECWNEVIDMTKNHFGIYHCYSGLEQTTKQIIEETNFLISFAASITYPKNEYLREAAKLIPLDRIVLETDCPFLPPQSKRGQRNEPTAVAEIAQLIADLKEMSLEEVVNQTTKNATKKLIIDSLSYL